MIHSSEDFYDVQNIMMNVATDESLVSCQIQANEDVATCIVDLQKVRDQHEIWQNAFKGKYL